MKSFSQIAVAAMLAFSLPLGATGSFAQEAASGVASWYGSKFHGRTTANGEKYDMNSLTAAHKTLPFGTKVKVTNTRNGKSVVVRINDRGPYAGKRVIDLSRSAAQAVGMVNSGTAQVKLDIMS